MTRVACSAARSARRASAATIRSRTSVRARPHLQLLDVLGEVARRHPGVDPLVAGQGRELLDARLHVVAGDPLPSLDAGEVDLVDDGHVVVDDLHGQVEAEVVLGAQDRHPQLRARAPPCAPATRCRPSARWRSGRPARWAGAHRAWAQSPIRRGSVDTRRRPSSRGSDGPRCPNRAVRALDRSEAQGHAASDRYQRDGPAPLAGRGRRRPDVGELRQAPARDGRRPLSPLRRIVV